MIKPFPALRAVLILLVPLALLLGGCASDQNSRVRGLKQSEIENLQAQEALKELTYREGDEKASQDPTRVEAHGDQFARLRVGIGSPPPQWDPADYVLGRFTAQERAVMNDAIPRAACGVEDWIHHGIEFCMNQYNGS